MAGSKRKTVQKKYVYFYLNNQLHKVIKRVRAEDLLIAWNFPEQKRVAYSLTDVNKNRQKAYTVGEVAKMFNRNPITIRRHMESEDIPYPQHIYSLSGKQKILKFMFSENDIRAIHDLFKSVHRGRPRRDGEITSSNVPSYAEIEALMRNEKVLYTKNDDGEFVVVWKQPEW